MAPINYYKLLNVDPKADLDTIKKAFRTEIAKYHPDKDSSAEAAERFNQLVEAFDILSDKEKRRTYDKMLNTETGLVTMPQQKEKEYKEWKKEAKKKSKTYRDTTLEDLLLLDIFLGGDILGGIFSGADDLLDGIGDVFDLF